MSRNHSVAVPVRKTKARSLPLSRGARGGTRAAEQRTPTISARKRQSARASGRRGPVWKPTDGDDGRGAHPEGALRVLLLEADADLEPIGQTYPVQRAPHLGQHPHRGPIVRSIGPA